MDKLENQSIIDQDPIKELAIFVLRMHANEKLDQTEFYQQLSNYKNQSINN
jgi:hypothetical protein